MGDFQNNYAPDNRGKLCGTFLGFIVSDII